MNNYKEEFTAIGSRKNPDFDTEFPEWHYDIEVRCGSCGCPNWILLSSKEAICDFCKGKIEIGRMERKEECNKYIKKERTALFVVTVIYFALLTFVIWLAEFIISKSVFAKEVLLAQIVFLVGFMLYSYLKSYDGFEKSFEKLRKNEIMK